VETFLTLKVPAAVGVARYALALSALSVFLFALHRVLPSRRMRGLSLWPGIFLTMALWMAAAIAFSVYLSYAPSYSVTYGGLAGAIITLLFFYITGAVIIFGAEVNAAVARLSGRLKEGNRS
jgi:membrane protein